jgi:ubiquinone/menaquinone biosynthesis C-methylase UbiE
MTSGPEKTSPSVFEVREMNYTDFIALLKETNRCPGGKKTIRRIRELIHIDNKTKILDVGSNTGFTSLELGRITPAHISGIDISEACIAESKALLTEDIGDVRSRIQFQVASAYDIPFPDNKFDIVMVGGATGFMDDKRKAITEYLRVLKSWGFLVLSQLTYHTQPPTDVVSDVSNIIGLQIKPMNKNNWISTVVDITKDFELYLDESHTLSSRTDEEIKKYIDYFINKDHIKVMPNDVKEAIRERWSNILKVFNENHKYLGYDIIIFRKRPIFGEPELFLSN